MPTIGPLHHHKPGTEAGRLACSEQRSICLSVSTTHASFAGEVQWMSLLLCGGLCISRFESYPLSQPVACFSALSRDSVKPPQEGRNSATDRRSFARRHGGGPAASLHREAAVHRQRLAGDERRGVRRQPQHGRGHLVGLADAADGMQALKLLPHVLRGDEAVKHVGVDAGGGHGVDADVFAGVLQRHRPGQPGRPRACSRRKPPHRGRRPRPRCWNC